MFLACLKKKRSIIGMLEGNSALYFVQIYCLNRKETRRHTGEAGTSAKKRKLLINQGNKDDKAQSSNIKPLQ
jgi:hypothetical protein